MISLIPPEIAISPGLRHTPGAFCWWYVDLVDTQGNGLVLIWSYGLPFLPGVTGPARAGRPVVPGQRPSVNLATYRDGRLDSYVLHEVDPASCAWSDDGDSQIMGGCRFDIVDQQGRRRLDITLDLPIPATQERLRGRVQVEGPLVRLAPGADANPVHAWGPVLTAAQGHADLFLGDQPVLQVEGAAYHDRNSSRRPLGALGIVRWRWARLGLPGRQFTWYQLTPDRRGEPGRSILVETHDDGTSKVWEDVPFVLRRPRLNPFLLGWHHEVEVDATARGGPRFSFTQGSPVDNGPFYLRFLIRGRDSDGQEGVGVSELVAPHRVDLGWLRPMVRLRVSSDRPGSWLQALFTGPKAGRGRRLIDQLRRPQQLLSGGAR